MRALWSVSMDVFMRLSRCWKSSSVDLIYALSSEWISLSDKVLHSTINGQLLSLTLIMVSIKRCSFKSTFLRTQGQRLSHNVGKSTYGPRIKLKAACASSQSDQSLRCPHEETLHPWLSKMCLGRIRIRLRECAVWSESSLGTHIPRYIFEHCGSYS